MNRSVKKIIVFIGAFLLFSNVWSQQWVAGEELILKVSFYCLMETNYAPVNLTFSVNEAGGAIAPVSNSDLFIKVSSICPGATHRELTARILSGTVPPGTILTLVSADCTTTNSGGELGVAFTTPIVLGPVDQDLVDLIGTMYTGTGYNDGYQQTFTWAPDTPANYHLIKSINTNIVVLFTITAHDSE